MGGVALNGWHPEILQTLGFFQPGLLQAAKMLWNLPNSTTRHQGNARK